MTSYGASTFEDAEVRETCVPLMSSLDHDGAASYGSTLTLGSGGGGGGRLIVGSSSSSTHSSSSCSSDEDTAEEEEDEEVYGDDFEDAGDAVGRLNPHISLHPGSLKRYKAYAKSLGDLGDAGAQLTAAPGKWRDRRKFKEGTRKTYPDIAINDRAANRSRRFPANTYHTTKYSWWSFVPKLLFEQLRRATTFYFTLIAIITLIPQVTPISPWTSVSGLVFILVVAALREGFEDIKRRLVDGKINRRKFDVLSAPQGDDNPSLDEHEEFTLKKCRSGNLRVGDLVYVKQDKRFPADLVLLKSGGEDGVAFIETASLDGETNLKIRRAPPATNAMSNAELSTLKATLQCEVPHHQLYSFRGSMELPSEISDRPIPVDQHQLLLGSSFLRNTPYVVGVIAYAGPETKQSLNQKKPPSKMSTLDRKLNLYVIAIFIFTVVMSLILCIYGAYFQSTYTKDSPYLDEEEDVYVLAVKLFFGYFVIMSFFIPLSLVVTLEVVKVAQGMFMEWDPHMMNEAGEGMKVKTTNLNDELGLVQYIFSDKTGTLTENEMNFKNASIMGHQYTQEELRLALEQERELVAEGSSSEERLFSLRMYAIILAVCHSAVADYNEDQDAIVYKSSSPDEEALCQAAAEMGFVFKHRSTAGITVEVEGEGELFFQLICSMDFTSSRRRMSVLVRFPEDEEGTRAYLLTKGADSMVYSRLRKGEEELKAKTQLDLDAFANEGLRTLGVGWRVLEEEELNAFLEAYEDAMNDIEHRDVKLEELFDGTERDFALLGATAIEDKLQEDVPETIEYLLRAGIRVWVITGDKQATAINIGYSTRLLQPDMIVVKINAKSSSRTLRKLQKYYDKYGKLEGDQKVAMVIDGNTLKYALRDCPDLLLNFSQRCHSVVCNRVTPLQKAQIVALVKANTSSVCLSIGDGSNDVGMIQEANIGVGIYGKEGNEAARSADFALRQFKHLKRLVCVQGRYSVVRNALVINYSFYKNAAIFMCQIWFAFYCGASSQTAFDEWVMTFFNIFFTALPPLVVGVYERDIPEQIILRFPEAYSRTQRGRIFTFWGLTVWMGTAVLHSIVFYFGAILLWSTLTDSTGRATGLFAFGNLIMSLGMNVIFIKLALELNYWNAIIHLSIWGSLAFYYLFMLLESGILYLFPTQFYVFYHLSTIPGYYFWILWGVVACLFTDAFIKYWKRMYWPEPYMVLQELTGGHGKNISGNRYTHLDKIVKQEPLHRFGAIFTR